jgi:hypothetical protein
MANRGHRQRIAQFLQQRLGLPSGMLQRGLIADDIIGDPFLPFQGPLRPKPASGIPD